jgi:hypothetical protein
LEELASWAGLMKERTLEKLKARHGAMETLGVSETLFYKGGNPTPLVTSRGRCHGSERRVSPSARLNRKKKLTVSYGIRKKN